jgi:acyl carrier protein
MAEVEPRLRGMLAEALGVPRAQVDALPVDVDLFAGPLPLTSLGGAQLLASIYDEYGLDLADEDLALDCLRSIATLRDSVDAGLRQRRAAGSPDAAHGD